MTLKGPVGWQVTASEYSPQLAPQDNTTFVMTKMYNKKRGSNSRNFCWPALVTGPARSQKFKCCPAVARLLSRCCPHRTPLPISPSLLSPEGGAHEEAEAGVAAGPALPGGCRNCRQGCKTNTYCSDLRSSCLVFVWQRSPWERIPVVPCRSLKNHREKAGQREIPKAIPKPGFPKFPEKMFICPRHSLFSRLSLSHLLPQQSLRQWKWNLGFSPGSSQCFVPLHFSQARRNPAAGFLAQWLREQ